MLKGGFAQVFYMVIKGQVRIAFGESFSFGSLRTVAFFSPSPPPDLPCLAPIVMTCLVLYLRDSLRIALRTKNHGFDQLVSQRN